MKIIPIISNIEHLFLRLNHFLHRTEEINVRVYRVFWHPFHATSFWYQRVVGWSVVGGKLWFCDGVGAAGRGEEEPLGCEDGGEVGWWKLRSVVGEIVFFGVVVVGEGCVEMEGVRWWWWWSSALLWVRLGENCRVFELEETEVKLFWE